jgi:DNA polymerase-3 subunit delta'
VSVFDRLVGQEPSVSLLSAAARGERTGHAFLLVGPPGSGRSVAATAFAAALQCADRTGCGECEGCRATLAGSHPDVTTVVTEAVSIGVKECRDLVVKAAMSPVLGRRQALIVTDADRLTETAADALLKALEEPAPRTVWMLCAPTVDDVPVTVRSRCRVVTLRTPPYEAVAAMLISDGIDEPVAHFAARAAQGHIGRARALASLEDVRTRRREVLQVPVQLLGSDMPGCLQAAANIVDAASADAAAAAERADAHDKDHLRSSLGFGEEKASSRHVRQAMREMEDRQKARTRRLQRDALDRALLDLSAFYRDVLVVRLDPARADSRSDLINAEMKADVTRVAADLTGEQALRCTAAISTCRERLEANVNPLIAFEALMVAIRTA